MRMEDMIIASVDDHLSEPPDMFELVLDGADLASAPKFLTTPEGKNFWSYQGIHMRSVGLNAVVGRPLEEYGMEPTSLDQLRKGCWDVHARIDDMNVNGIAVSLNFPQAFSHDGGRFYQAEDKRLAAIHLRAYNDWHLDVWCAAYPGRFIPCAILPLWDMEATVAEIARVAAKGCTAVTVSDNPTAHGLPSIHNAYFEPFFKAIADHDMTICCHIGVGNPAPIASSESPIEAWITTMPMSISTGAADWLNLEALQRYPDLRICLAEGGIGWIPYFLERADFANSRHKYWTHSIFQDKKPSEVFHRHFMNCFVDDKFGLRHLDEMSEDMVAYECDYPHSDSLWPDVPEHLWESVKILTDTQIDKVTHLNALRFFRFDPFAHHAREELTVGALRAAARAANVDTTPRSSGGERPLGEGERRRPITSGDLQKMFSRHAENA